MDGRRRKEKRRRRVQNCNSNHGIKPKCNGLTTLAISFENVLLLPFVVRFFLL